MNAKSRPQRLAVPPQPTDHLSGALHARVTLIEYGDFQCPSCKSAAPTPKLMLERFPNKMLFIFRHFPLEDAHAHALLAAEAAEAAASQGKFWEMHDLLFLHQPRLEGRDLQRYAAEIGLDMVRYHAEMDDHIYLQKVREHIDGGRRSHVRATPAFFVDGIGQDASYGMQPLHEAVADAVKRAEVGPAD